MPADFSKAGLRRAVRAAVSHLDPLQRGRDEAALIGRLLTQHDFQTAPVVLLFVSVFPEEIDTRMILDVVLDSGRTLVLPRVDRTARRLVLHKITDPASELRPATLGILEPDPATPSLDPVALSWVLVPGLAFDREGYRLGRGGGFYDRLLATLPHHVACWSLAFDCQVVDALPREPHDQSIHGILTPTETITGQRRLNP